MTKQTSRPSGELSAPVASAPNRRLSQGPVMPIGGAEDKGEGGEILERFVALAGGKRARIAIIPTASEEATEAGERYIGVFRELGGALRTGCGWNSAPTAMGRTPSDCWARRRGSSSLAVPRRDSLPC
jgi:hypothetical protein